MLGQLKLQLNHIDLIVVSSGTGELNPGLDYTMENETISINIMGFTAVAGWAFHCFMEQGGGHLAVISSIAGLRGSRHAPAYNASKAYQINYLEGLQQKVARLPLPITITDIRPGFVNTAMAKGEGMFWVAEPERAAAQIVEAIRRKRKVVYVTKRWRLVAMLFKLMPRYIYYRL